MEGRKRFGWHEQMTCVFLVTSTTADDACFCSEGTLACRGSEGTGSLAGGGEGGEEGNTGGGGVQDR
jgi:hypothetical protein